MWKARPEDNKPMSMNPTQPSQPAPPLAAATITPSAPASTPVPQKETPKVMEPHRGDVGHIGKSVHIKGELTGSEDLYLDGEIEGTIDLHDHSLIIGPNGRIKASISARDLVVHGKVEGSVNATGRVELRKSCTLIGDVGTQRIVIEDGAFFKGAIDIRDRDKDSKEPRKPLAAAASAGTGMSSSSSSGASSSGISYNAAPGTQGSFLDPK